MLASIASHLEPFDNIAMSGLALNWNVRAAQAAPIPEEEWEKHKALICQLRPTMTLDRLIEVMAERVGFKAS